MATAIGEEHPKTISTQASKNTQLPNFFIPKFFFVFLLTICGQSDIYYTKLITDRIQ
jgi:hypothetical protein